MDRRFSRPRFDKGSRFERGGRSDRGGGWFEKPVKEGETYDVEIQEIGSKGDGIARVKNFVIFVPDVKQGEKCKIRINSVARRFATAEKVGKVGEKAEEKPKEKVESVEEPEEAEVEAVGED